MRNLIPEEVNMVSGGSSIDAPDPVPNPQGPVGNMINDIHDALYNGFTTIYETVGGYIGSGGSSSGGS